MNVEVLAWGPSEALARVDGVRVRIRRYRAAVVWLCADCGSSRNAPGCGHALALAETPAEATQYVNGPRFGDRCASSSSPEKRERS